ncbi:Type cbb3 cytochrome oxidase biogenesis protein CcoI; Copper-translocating P-type ATPase [Castellaniella defragrans 65Phen]|uniref:Type cbb3 cytochrome oxidase biogenesis protein CcoI Copper-translocating P-type ATPase n=3 Tax=Castellaniella defragrans TaxID=75697 RepID=W8WW12_CASD6|nr:Type cbb3 cytochrome oxidase biogenesis protein CcoI; Copper-translocating P-type ATPase [Castellaniella defragrans 65Phen]
MSDAMRRARRHMLARTGLAWLVMMQVMMLAFPGYLRHGARAPDAQQSLEQAIVLMNWLSLVLCVPLVLYCAWPVWRGAWRSLSRRRIGMDVPVALGILAAFVPSVAATWRDTGEVYFDSVSMFVAFLLTARFLETCARQAVSGQSPEARDAALLRSADRLAFWFVCAQILLAAAVGLYWWHAQPGQALAVTVALLVISCPCALSMSVPAALAARHAARLRAGADGVRDPAALDRAMRRIARQNLHGSLAWHLLMAPLAAVGWVQPWVAAITMLLSSLAVAANAWRLVRPAGGGVAGRRAAAQPV